MNDTTLIIGGLLALLLIAMLILAALALTLRGFQTLTATIVSLLSMGLHRGAESRRAEGEEFPQKGAIVAQHEDPPPAFGSSPGGEIPPAGEPPGTKPHPNGRGKV